MSTFADLEKERLAVEFHTYTAFLFHECQWKLEAISEALDYRQVGEVAEAILRPRFLPTTKRVRLEAAVAQARAAQTKASTTPVLIIPTRVEFLARWGQAICNLRSVAGWLEGEILWAEVAKLFGGIPREILRDWWYKNTWITEDLRAVGYLSAKAQKEEPSGLGGFTLTALLIEELLPVGSSYDEWVVWAKRLEARAKLANTTN